MTYPQERFFKGYEYHIDQNIKLGLNELCSVIIDRLRNDGIHKFTIVLGDEDNVNVTIVNDIDRTYTLIDQIDTLYGEVKIYRTVIDTINYSEIPMIFVVGNDLFKNIVNGIRSEIIKYIPDGYNIGTHNGNTYLIYTEGFTGQLWNIHRDAFDYKAHLVLTDCDQEFVWYLNNDGEKYKAPLKKDTLYFFNVRTPHTIMVNGYGQDQCRIHLVIDLVSEDQQK